jgi:hypothetical protein
VNIVRMRKSDLKEKLLANREAHIKQYAEAKVGFYLAVEESLDKSRNALNAQKDAGTVANVLFNEIAPESHLKEYDRALHKLELSVDDVIELSDQDFQQYVQNEWNWSARWEMSNSKYVAMAGNSRR